ncbi:MAG: putative manganese-dependent inorganic diphosphatase [Clostridium sp.]|uniref:putative manganese-dependent inorganic diphosphatase n=1 Tax=Clostridium sp. TaxID=1506 RepID=UPI0039E994FE
MKDVIYITGHKNPDSDSICAAVAYSEFKNKTGSTKAIPLRQGELSRETKFILDYFDVEEPLLKTTMKLQISDLNFDNISPITADVSLKKAWSLMKENNVKSLPVVDNQGKLKGLASISNLISTYISNWDDNILSKSSTKIDNILDALSAKAIYLSSENPSFPGKIIVAAMLPESFEEYINEGDIVISGDRKDIQSIIVKAKASLLIVTGNHDLSEEILEKAKKAGTSIILTPYDSFTTARLIVQSIPVGYILNNSEIITFNVNDYIEDAKDTMIKTRYKSYPVLDESNKVVGTISRDHLISKNKKKLILVDHNEKSQTIDGLEDAEILEIIDHHRIGDIQTGSPIYFRNQPIGSSSSIVGLIFFENGITPSKKAAGLLCGAIISDTLLFRSPTTTDTDRTILKKLAEIAEIDPEDFASKMFKAGTSLEGKTVTEIFNQDYKIFNLSDYKVGVSQVSTMDLEGFEPTKPEMINYMETKAKDEKFNVLLLLLTDILKGGSQLIAVGPDRDIVSKAFDVKLENNSAYAPGVLSRKKQVIPPLTNTIEALNQ